MGKEYSDSSIEVLEGLTAIRKRPGMYIGSTDSRGLHHLVWELVDNSIDEAMGGYGNKILVTIHKEGTITVEDFGRGIPIGKNKNGLPTPQIVYTVMNSGGKFNDSTYDVSVGLHGIGAAAVTALSEYVELSIFRDGKNYKQRFEKGGSKIYPPVITQTNTRRTGTIATFKPDKTVFETVEFKHSTISEKLREKAFLLPGVQIILTDERSNKVDTFCSEKGLEDYIDFINEDREKLTNCFIFRGNYNGIGVEVAIQYTSNYDETIISFANDAKTIDGGTHETGFRTAFTKCLNQYALANGLIKERDKIDGSDYREGLTCIVSCKIPEKYLQFENQTKTKLGSPEVRNAVDNVLMEKLSYFLAENKEVANLIISKAKKASLAREAARKAREEIRTGKKKKEERILSGKLVPAQSKKALDCELFLVEGDSAGGSAKQGRDVKYQAVLPLRGKVINSEKNDIQDLLKNEEISTMIYTIGAGYGHDFNINDANYGKIVIMTDADTDGAHIQILLLAFFFKYMRPMVEAGRVYVACPPLYKVFKQVGKEEKFIYCYNDVELEEAKTKIGSGYSIQRYKGLGEMNPSQLWDTTMNPETRSLIQVTISDIVAAEKKMTTLMGKESSLRREWIEDNVQFTLEDDFIKEVK